MAYFNETYHVTYYQVHMALMAFSTAR